MLAVYWFHCGLVQSCKEGLQVLCPLAGGQGMLWKGVWDSARLEPSLQGTGQVRPGSSFLCDPDEKGGGAGTGESCRHRRQ